MLKNLITRIQNIFLIQIVLIGVLLYTSNCYADIHRKKTHNFYFSITDIRDSSKAIEVKEKFISKYSFKEYEPESGNNNNINLYKSDITRIQAFHLRISLVLKGILTNKYKIKDVKYKTAIGRKRSGKISPKKRKENQKLHIF